MSRPGWFSYLGGLLPRPGAPEEDLGAGEDRISDPRGHGPDIWFRVTPETKAVKNRLHLDMHAGGGRTVPIETRRQQLDAEENEFDIT